MGGVVTLKHDRVQIMSLSRNVNICVLNVNNILNFELDLQKFQRRLPKSIYRQIESLQVLSQMLQETEG